ncbi:XRE family transcriptional regulator [Limnochorda pilosa]|uniref:XRE family transcriptional regulator n=1 Tax=Limnochorda pilosa TaxID=1555112 RepID=A0A0K2SHZ0_LIMPI|nr:XRE family transcriptional regulator [Limnochorda pilosa]
MRLPLHLKWSGPREYDLDDPADRRRVYEIVLREGRSEDVRTYIDPGQLLTMWKELVLPANVRAAWRDYFVLKRGIDPEAPRGGV